MYLKTRTKEVKTAENPIKAPLLIFPPLGRLFGLSLPFQALGELGGLESAFSGVISSCGHRGFGALGFAYLLVDHN